MPQTARPLESSQSILLKVNFHYWIYFRIFFLIPAENRHVISRRSELLSLLAYKAILVDKMNFGMLVLNIIREIKGWNIRLHNKMTTDKINIYIVGCSILKSRCKIVPIFELTVATARTQKCAICSRLCWRIRKLKHL